MTIRPGSHGWYVALKDGETVDGPYFTKREAEEVRILLLENQYWRHYYKTPEMLKIVSESKDVPTNPKGQRTWKQVLRP